MAEKKTSSPVRGAAKSAQGGVVSSPSTPGTPGTPGVSNDELLNSLQSRAQVFNQLWQAVEKVQGDSISIATWKAKLKELEDAKAVNKKLSNELKQATGRNAELITHNAALMSGREDMNRELGLREGRIEGLGEQLRSMREEIAVAHATHAQALEKEQRAKALTAGELRDKVAELLSAQGHITEMASELQSLKTELLRSKEISRINSEGIANELKASKEHVKALEADKASISQHLWNVTDEIKKLAKRLEQAEMLASERADHLATARGELADLQASSAATRGELEREVERLRNRNEELADETAKLRRWKEQNLQDQDAQTRALRKELQDMSARVRTYEEERDGMNKRTKAAEEALAAAVAQHKIDVEENALKLSDERTAHRELRQKMEAEIGTQNARNGELLEQLAAAETQREQQATVLDELRNQAVAARERIRDLERAAQEGDLAMGSVRKKLEQHLARARAEVKRLTEGLDAANVEHARVVEDLMTRLRNAEEKSAEAAALHQSASTDLLEREKTLTAENYQLRELVGKANAGLAKEKQRIEQLQSERELLRLDAEKEVGAVQGELSRCLEQAVADAEKARKKGEEQRTLVGKLETEKREILQEASKLNAELGTQLNEVKGLRQAIETKDADLDRLKRELDMLRQESGDGVAQRRALESTLEDHRRKMAAAARSHAEAEEVSRKELKLAQKEAAERVAKFSEHGRAMAQDIERLTSKQTELVSNLEQREAELKKMTASNKEMKSRIEDVKRLRSEVAGDLDAARQSLKEERANTIALQEEKQTLIHQLDQEKSASTATAQNLKIALRTQKKIQRDVDKVNKEKLQLETQLERERSVAPPLQAQIRAQRKEIQDMEQKVKERIIAKDLAEKRAKKQAGELGEEIKQLTIHVQVSRQATDDEKARRLKVEKEAKEFETEAQQTVNELMRQLKNLKLEKTRSNEKLQQQLDTQLEYASTMKRERDRQITNSKSASEALREDAETQRRLAGLLEKEKTELKAMLQEKWKEARHLKDRLEETEAKLYEAGHSMDNWEATKRDLEAETRKQKRELAEIKSAAAATEDRLGAELKDATSRASQMAAELTTLKHSALWNDRELGNKVQLLTREVEVMNGQLQAKESALQRSQEQEIHLKGVCEELKGQAEAMAAEMRQKMKELSGANEKKLETMRQQMTALRARSLEAQEEQQRMKLEVRSRRLESESLARELKSMTATSDENSRAMESAEESRTALLNELDRTRQDKTDLVKAMVEERNAAADEAGALQRNISGLNARIRQLTDELEQSHRTRKSLRNNLRRQVINELRGAGWTAPVGYSSSVLIDPMDTDDEGYGGGVGNRGMKKKKSGTMRDKADRQSPKMENPIAKMRRLREALTQSNTRTASPTSSAASSAVNTARTNAPPPQSAGSSNPKTPPPAETKSEKLTHPVEYKMTISPPDGRGGSSRETGRANDLGSPVTIVDRNPRDIGFAPPGSAGKAMSEMDVNSRPSSSGDPVEDSVNRTERFLEKRRRRDKALQQQVQGERAKSLEREGVHAATVARKSSSREGKRERKGSRGGGGSGIRGKRLPGLA